jgi:hypothetical protein
MLPDRSGSAAWTTTRSAATPAGWLRHMTLAMAAHAHLTILRARELDTDKAETDPHSSSTSASPKSDA